MKWTGELADVCANSIKRFVEWVGRERVQTVKPAFVTDFLSDISVALQQLPYVGKINISDLIPTAKVSKRIWEPRTVRVLTQSKGPKENKWQLESFSSQCFRCWSLNLETYIECKTNLTFLALNDSQKLICHQTKLNVIRDCQELPGSNITCYRCKVLGHGEELPLGRNEQWLGGGALLHQ